MRLLGALALVAALVAGTALGALTLFDRELRSNAAASLERQPSRAQSLRLSASVDSGRAGTRALRSGLPSSLAITESAMAPSLPSETAAGRPVVVGSVARTAGLRLVDGAWPAASSGSTERADAALQADAARALGVGAGDDLRLRSGGVVLTLRIVGLWRVADASDPRWFGDPLVASGGVASSSGDLGPALVSDGALERLAGIDSTRSWTVSATTASTSPDALPAARAGVATAHRALASALHVPLDSVDVDGSLPDSLESLARTAAVDRALTSVALGLVAVVGLVAMVQLGAVLGSARRSETTLLIARGATRSQIARSAVVETVLVTVPSAAVGAAIGALSAMAGPTGFVGGAENPTPRGALVVAGVGLLSALAVPIGSLAVSPTEGGRRRGGAPTLVVLLVPLAALAALGAWRLGLAGSPLEPDARPDLLAAASPVLLLLVVALATVLVVLAGARLTGVALAGRASWLVGFAARQTSRRATSFAALVLAFALAVGTAGFSAAFVATSARSERLLSNSVIGADAAIDVEGAAGTVAGRPAVTAAALGGLAGVAAAHAQLRGSATLGGVSVGMVAVAAKSWQSTTPSDVAPVVRALGGTRLDGVGLPGSARRLSVRVATTSPATAGVDTTGAVSLVAWLADDDGAVLAAPLRTAADTGAGEATTTGTAISLGSTGTVSTALPPATGAWRLLAIDPTSTFEAASLPGPIASSTLSVGDIRVGADATATPSRRVSGGVTADLRDGASVGRLSLTPPSTNTAAPRAVITATLASRLGTGKGARLDVGLPATNSSVSVVVSAVVPEIPGAGQREAVVLDLPRLVDDAVRAGGAVPVARTIAVRSARDDTLARTVPPLFADPVQVSVSGTGSSATSAATRPVRLSSIGAGALALVVLGAAAAGLARDRRDELVALAALGVRRRAVAAERVLELAAAATAAIAGGLASGVVTSAVTAASFGIAAVPGAEAVVTIGPLIDLPLWLGFTAILAAGASVVVAVSGVLAARDSRRQTEGDRG